MDIEVKKETERVQLAAAQENEAATAGETKAEAEHKKYTAWQKFRLGWNIATLAFYCFYVIFFVVNKLGNPVVNYVLMASTAVYFVLFVGLSAILGRKGKRFSGASKRVYKVIRRFTLLINTILTGGAIINMSGFASGLMIRVCAFIMIANLALNVVWLFVSYRLEKKYKRQLRSLKSSAREFAHGLKALFKKGFDGRREEERDNAAADGTAAVTADDSKRTDGETLPAVEKSVDETNVAQPNGGANG